MTEGINGSQLGVESLESNQEKDLIERKKQLGKRVREAIIGNIPDETPLIQASPLGIRSSSGKAWDDLIGTLSTYDKKAITKIFLALARANIIEGGGHISLFNTVGDVRNASLRDLESTRGIGRQGTVFIQEAFRRPESIPAQEASVRIPKRILEGGE